ncbi:MAG TPA: hypothetical protein VN604_11155 [Nitrospirota bacterium]|nr:hypothetical protein [Nitrospirota bacterium]
MKRKPHILILIILVVSVILPGCVLKKADLSVVGTKNLNLDMIGFEKVGENVTGESSSYSILLIPFNHMTIEGAVQNALQKVNGDVMTDTAVYYKLWMIPPFYGKTAIEVTGTVWKQKSSPGPVIQR